MSTKDLVVSHEGPFERLHPGVLLSGTTGRIPRFLTGTNTSRTSR
jgi:hypothetical protein